MNRVDTLATAIGRGLVAASMASAPSERVASEASSE